MLNSNAYRLFPEERIYHDLCERDNRVSVYSDGGEEEITSAFMNAVQIDRLACAALGTP